MSQFRLLVRTFFERFFDNELVSSAIELRQALIFLLALLTIVPAFMAMGSMGGYMFVSRRTPWMLERFSWPHKLFFITYSMMIVGLAAVMVWDSLTIDRRDAMILGSLPVRGRTIVSAKLAALLAFLLLLAVTINVPCAFVYASDFADARSPGFFVRVVGAQLAGTVVAAAWVFTTLIAVQGLLSAVPRRLGNVITIVFQALFVATLFSMLVLMPVGLRATVGAFQAMDASTSRTMSLVPPVWFLGLYETLLGSPRPMFHRMASIAAGALAVSTVAAVLVTAGAYLHQLRYAVEAAVAPSAAGSLSARARARVLRVMARTPDAQAVLGFTLISMARSRKHQLLLAAYAGAGLAVVVAVLVHGAARGGMASLGHPRVAVLWIPLVMILWLLVGLRATFRMPTELPASWTFHVNASGPASAYAPAARAAAVLIVLAPVLATSLIVYAWLCGWTVAAIHVTFCGLMGAALLEVLFARFDQIPFTRAYEAGRANVRVWWPLYVLALEAYAHWPTYLALWMLRQPGRSINVLVAMTAALLVLRWRCRRSISKTSALVFEVTPERTLSTLELSG